MTYDKLHEKLINKSIQENQQFINERLESNLIERMGLSKRQYLPPYLLSAVDKQLKAFHRVLGRLNLERGMVILPGLLGATAKPDEDGVVRARVEMALSKHAFVDARKKPISFDIPAITYTFITGTRDSEKYQDFIKSTTPRDVLFQEFPKTTAQAVDTLPQPSFEHALTFHLTTAFMLTTYDTELDKGIFIEEKDEDGKIKELELYCVQSGPALSKDVVFLQATLHLDEIMKHGRRGDALGTPSIHPSYRPQPTEEDTP